jgi:hypothetical protein
MYSPSVPCTSYQGVSYNGLNFADEIRSSRQHLPRDVQDMLTMAESSTADYPAYHHIVPKLRESLDRTDSYNKLMGLPWDVYNLTRKLIGIIEIAHRNNVPIPRPETREESQARAQRPFEYGPHPRPHNYNHKDEQERQRQHRTDEWDSDDYDDPRYNDYYDDDDDNV